MSECNKGDKPEERKRYVWSCKIALYHIFQAQGYVSCFIHNYQQ
jgi:hypothetical protein